MECKDIIEINGVEYIRKTLTEKASENYCIVRTYSAGVFAGNIIDRDDKECTIKNARRLWYWDGAASLSQLAMEGTKKPKNCKFPCPVNEITVNKWIEIIPCTKKAEMSIKEVPVWQS